MKQMSLNQFENKFKLITETLRFYCIIRFYTLLAFQGHKVCNFWTYESKDMIYTRFKQILIQILIRILFRTRSRHVA
jgi:hypothetical protein